MGYALHIGVYLNLDLERPWYIVKYTLLWEEIKGLGDAAAFNPLS